MSRAARVLRRWGPVILCAGAIFALSSLPLRGVRLPLFELRGIDKVVHAVEYLGLALVLCRAAERPGRRFWWPSAVLVIALSAAYGVTDELHQRFTPGRTSTGWDVAADAVGASLGAFLWPLLTRAWPWLRA